MPQGKKQKIVLIVLTIIWVLITALRVWSMYSYSERKPVEVNNEAQTLEKGLYFNLVYKNYNTDFRKAFDYINLNISEFLTKSLSEKPGDPIIQAKLCIVEYARETTAQLQENRKKQDIAKDASTNSAIAFKKIKDNPKASPEMIETLQALYFTPGSSLAPQFDKTKLETYINKNFEYWYRDYSLFRLYQLTGNTSAGNAIVSKAGDIAKRVLFGAILLLIICVAGFAGFFILLILPLASYFVYSEYSLTGERISDLNNPAFSGLLPWKAWLVFIGWELLRFFAALNLGFIASRHTGLPIIIMFIAYLGVYACILWFAFRVFSDKIAKDSKTEDSNHQEEESPEPPSPVTTFSVQAIGINKPGGLNPFWGIIFGIAGYCAAIPLVITGSYLYKYVAGSFPKSQNVALDIIGNINTVADGIMIFLLIGVIGPIFEEILFRGYIYTTLRRYMPAYACVLLVSFLFSAIHFDFNMLLGLFIIGAVLAVLYERTGSLTPSIVTHMIWNSMTFFLMITLIK
jgi:membrane protease YdiL (CAAX protease family)